MCGVTGVLAALFPAAWTNLFTDSDAVLAAILRVVVVLVGGIVL
jgi:hypothetical protein